MITENEKGVALEELAARHSRWDEVEAEAYCDECERTWPDHARLCLVGMAALGVETAATPPEET